MNTSFDNRDLNGKSSARINEWPSSASLLAKPKQNWSAILVLLLTTNGVAIDPQRDPGGQQSVQPAVPIFNSNRNGSGGKGK